MSVIHDYLATANVAGHLLRSDSVAANWTGPSALTMWSVAGLSGHLARSVFLVPGVLDAAVDPESPQVSAADYFVRGLSNDDLSPTSSLSESIRARGLESAGEGPEELLSRFDTALRGLEDSLPTVDPDVEVSALGMRMPFRQYLVSRLIELTVHADDLAVSVGVPTPDFPTSAQDRVVGTLASIAAHRHGFTPVLRGLARSERVTSPFSAF
jgi:uncharacterized protein (TIGR03083 family)